MKKENLELKDNKNESHKYRSIGMSLGMCFGVSIGLSMGYLLFDNGTTGMSIGIPLGMLIGMAIGSIKDRAINEQLKEKEDTIPEIVPEDDK